MVGLSATAPPAHGVLSELIRGLSGALGMGAKVKVDLDGVNTSNAVLLRCPMEDTLVVGYDEPYIGASCLLSEGESFEKRRWRVAHAGKTSRGENRQSG